MTITQAQPPSETLARKRSFWEADPIYKKSDNWRLNPLRVVDYIRVSTDKDDQQNSFENQRDHYEKLIKSHPHWQYVGTYSDEGISGTATFKRVGFQRMLKDCQEGKIDLVIVKDVSRFARNTVDCIESVRLLLRLDPPVGVFFDFNNINTLDVGSELFLTMFAMFAQMESELKSGSVRFGLEQNIQRGDYLCPTLNLLGYDKIKKYSMEVEPKGAKAVRLIYKMFLSGIPRMEIAKVLMSIGVPTGGDMLKWTTNTVTGILRNERYCGDIVTSKMYIEDIFTHKPIKNTGQRNMMYEQDHHEAIVSRNEHRRALLLLKTKYTSPHFNLHYEIEVIRKGILTGFIPLNIAFGGYEAGYYLGAIENANLPEIQFDEPLQISKSISGEVFNFGDKAWLRLSRNTITFNSHCVEHMNCDYVELLLHPEEKLLAVRKTTSRNPNAVALANKSIVAAINLVIYNLMGWKRDFSHKMLADIFEKHGQTVMFFDLRASEYHTKSKAYLPEEWIHVFDKPLNRLNMLTRLHLAKTLRNWEVNAKATPVEDFDTVVSATPESEQQILIEELEKEYVGWKAPENRKKRKKAPYQIEADNAGGVA